MSPSRAVFLALALVGLSCAYLPDSPEPSLLVCRNDSECAEGQVCFADGCGDPGQNIVVEVTPNPKAGLHAQDFPVENLRPQQNLELFGPARLQGQVRREQPRLNPDGTPTTTAYLSPISVLASGESLLIPGATRRYEGTLVPDSSGYQLPVGSGRFTVTLQTADPEVPPQQVDGVAVEPGRAVPVDFLLPSSVALTRLAGKVVLLEGVLVDADLEVQALDDALKPLSQRVPVKRTTGEFLLALPPSAALRDYVLVQVTAPTAEALVPRKVFTVDPRPGLTPPLVMGDYGTPVKVRGRVVDRAGQPVRKASVYLQGQVGGGGHFRGLPVLTGNDGRFELESLPSHPDTPLTLYAVPPPGTIAGLTLQPTPVPRGGITLAQDVVCPDKIVVRGTLLRPEGGAAAGVRVVAEPVGAVTGWPRPARGAEADATTDEAGGYSLRLDPGEYRFDFLPGENLPRVSRFVTVLPAEALELAPFTLSKGRRISGRVTIQGDASQSPNVPYASIRFFRVVNVEGRPDAVLLAETVADGTGAYATTLPTR